MSCQTQVHRIPPWIRNVLYFYKNRVLARKYSFQIVVCVHQFSAVLGSCLWTPRDITCLTSTLYRSGGNEQHVCRAAAAAAASYGHWNNIWCSNICRIQNASLDFALIQHVRISVINDQILVKIASTDLKGWRLIQNKAVKRLLMVFYHIFFISAASSLISNKANSTLRATVQQWWNKLTVLTLTLSSWCLLNSIKQLSQMPLKQEHLCIVLHFFANVQLHIHLMYNVWKIVSFSSFDPRSHLAAAGLMCLQICTLWFDLCPTRAHVCPPCLPLWHHI